MSPDPQNLDFRSLEILCVVHRERSFGRAAELLQVNQSVVSYAIAKLRKTFGDPLFLRVGSRTEPTARCEEIVAWAHDALTDFEAVRITAPFDPATARARFVIACNFYERLLLIPSIVAMLRGAAPGLDLEIVDAAGTGHERLQSREADLLIGPYRRQDAGFYSRTLLTDSYVCLMDRAHPQARSGDDLTLDAYLALDHILITYGGRWTSPFVTGIERAGYRLEPAIRVPSPAGIAELVKGSTLVATIPARLAAGLGRGLVTMPCPVDAELPVRLVWDTASHHAPISRWARDRIAATVADWLRTSGQTGG